MNVNFLFMDDSYDKETGISSITALLLPLNRYSQARLEYYKIAPRADKILADGTSFVDIRTPELHGNELLKDLHDANDDQIFATLERIVKLVNSQELGIYRSGYYITRRIRKLTEEFGVDRKMMDICWATILSMLEPKLSREFIIPVMDGFSASTVKAFSMLVKNLDQMRSVGWTEHMSIKHTENILGEVFYCDSEYSIFTQIVDVVAYLRHIADLSREGKGLSEFKQRLLTIAEQLSPSIIREEVTMLNVAEQET